MSRDILNTIQLCQAVISVEMQVLLSLNGIENDTTRLLSKAE